MKLNTIYVGLGILLLCAMDAQASTVRATITASRQRCFSPCTVVFSAEATRDLALVAQGEEPFHALGYHFNFDDPTSGFFATSGLSKNQQIGGPLAAHTFVCDSGTCSFEVGVRAQNAMGDYDDAFVTVRVSSADAFFRASRTICVSGSENYGGDVPCPPGAVHATEVPSFGQWSGHRVLLRRGETFSPPCIRYLESNVLIEDFGDLADPRPELTGTASVGVDGSCNDRIPNDAAIGALDGSTGFPQRWAENITLTRLRIPHIVLGMSYTHVTLHDIDMAYEDEPSGGAISLAHNTNACLSNGSLTCASIPYPVGAYLSELTIEQSDAEVLEGGGIGFGGVNIGGFNCPMINWITLLGSTVRNALEHNYRTEGTWRTFVGHNRMLGHHYRDRPDGFVDGDIFPGVRHKVTVRACGSGVIDPESTVYRHQANEQTPGSPMTRYTLVADNVMGSDDDFGGGARMTMSPTHALSAEVISLGIAERNTFVQPAALNTRDIFLAGHQLSCRDNQYTEPTACRPTSSDSIPDPWGESPTINPTPPPVPDAPSRPWWDSLPPFRLWPPFLDPFPLGRG